MSNHIHYEVWDEIICPFQISSAPSLKFGNGYVISSYILLDMWSLIHAGIKLIDAGEIVSGD